MQLINLHAWRSNLGLLGIAGLIAFSPAAFSPAYANEPNSENSFPKRKAGLWQIKVAGLEQAGMPASLYCVGENTDTAQQHLDRKAANLGACTLGTFKPAQGGWIAESLCKDNKITVKSQAVLTGDLATEYRIDTLVSYLPAAVNSKKSEQDSLAAKYLGACPTAAKPGDLIIAGMGALNLSDGTFRAEPKKRPPKRAKKQR
jgi:hypothetical protein